MVRNFPRTKDRLCTTLNSAVENYVVRILKEGRYCAVLPRCWLPHSTMDGLTLALPYKGERPARRMNLVAKESRLPIRLVFRPPPTLKDLLTSSRIYEGKCLEVDCRYCTEEKICEPRGETKQKLAWPQFYKDGCEVNSCERSEHKEKFWKSGVSRTARLVLIITGLVCL
ncbi:hypothetical protein Y032_0068g147 [Ancylostoma ceylanicum]|uniref:Uncharacterized protein n=1 Tax=Ancylostoma ceylanicum TaxID=53326 RepID=A0A016TYE7_9BILA|nr:hypothetical protein Y032_0068g147 [Ancylostoma ceylanicum]